MSMTQEQTILSYLQEGNTLTSMAAFNLFGITKLAARVSDLRKKGYPIQNDLVNVPTRYKPVKVANYYYGDVKKPTQGDLDL